ncbi:hypothetical protein L1887_60921 [Cichorium endivia]|nr:hypothetical protein L1887_60921 [Cichorium endivia]
MCPLVVSFGVIESPPRTSCTKRLWERAGIEVPDGQCIDHRGLKQAEQRPLQPAGCVSGHQCHESLHWLAQKHLGLPGCHRGTRWTQIYGRRCWQARGSRRGSTHRKGLSREGRSESYGRRSGGGNRGRPSRALLTPEGGTSDRVLTAAVARGDEGTHWFPALDGRYWQSLFPRPPHVRELLLRELEMSGCNDEPGIASTTMDGDLGVEIMPTEVLASRLPIAVGFNGRVGIVRFFGSRVGTVRLFVELTYRRSRHRHKQAVTRPSCSCVSLLVRVPGRLFFCVHCTTDRCICESSRRVGTKTSTLSRAFKPPRPSWMVPGQGEQPPGLGQPTDPPPWIPGPSPPPPLLLP